MGLIQPSGRPSLKWKPVFRRPSNPKLLITWLSGLLVVLSIAAVILHFVNDKASTPSVAQKVNPCAIFTLQDAKILLGDKIQKGGVAPVARAASQDFKVTTCSYMQKPPETKASTVGLKNAVVVLSAPKTDAGKAFNEFEFADGKPKNVHDVSGYGKKAYWDPSTGSLSVLKNGKWATLSYGVATPISARTLDDTKKLADIVVPKF